MVANISRLQCFFYRNCGRGEGIFTFYAPHAKEMVMALAETSRNVESKKPVLNNQQGKHNGKGRQHTPGKLNPWKTLFKKSGQATLKQNASNHEMPTIDKSSKNVVSRSSSVVIGKSRSSYDGKSNNPDEIYDHTAQNQNQDDIKSIAPSISLYQVMKRENSFHVVGMSNDGNTFSKNNEEIPSTGYEHRNVIVENQIKNQAKKCASESDLISAEYEVIHDTRDGNEETGAHPKSSQTMLNTNNPTKISDAVQYSDCESNTRSRKTNNAEGFYRSFDDDIDDIDLGVLANSNSLEASIVLRTQPQVSGPYITNSNDKTNNLADSGARLSYNSSCDSGRISDTYAETSNSSVTSGFSNRVYSNTSNCSGDSGAQLSYTSDTNSVSTASSSNLKENTFTTRPLLEALAEQESPVNHDTFQHFVDSKHTKNSVNDTYQHDRICELENSEHVNNYSVSSSTLRSEKGAYNDTQGCISMPPCLCYSRNVIIQDKHQQQTMKENVESNRLYMQSTPVLGPRFATVRKSLTLPHIDINNAAFSSGYSMDNKTNDALTENNNKSKINMQENIPTSQSFYSSSTTDTKMTNQCENARRKDLSRFLGVKDEGPGSPSKKVAQYIAIQNYQSLQYQHKVKSANHYSDSTKEVENIYGSRKNSNTQSECMPDTKRKDIETFLGIKSSTNNKEEFEVDNAPPQRKPIRPKSLIGLRLASSLERRNKNTSQPNFDVGKCSTLEKKGKESPNDAKLEGSNTVNNKSLYAKHYRANERNASKSTRPFAVNRTLTRFQHHFNKEKFHSAPTTPESSIPTVLGAPPHYYNNDASADISPRRKNLERFLGINNEHYKTLRTEDTVVLPGILQKKRLYRSTPDELEISSPSSNPPKVAFNNTSEIHCGKNENVSTIKISSSNQPKDVSSSLYVKEGATHISIQSGSQNSASAIYANRGLVFRFTPSQRSNSADRSTSRSQHSASIITINSSGKSSFSSANSPCQRSHLIHENLKDSYHQKPQSMKPLEVCNCGTSSPVSQSQQCSCSQNVEWRAFPSMSMDRNFKMKNNEKCVSGRYPYATINGIGAASLPRSNHKCTSDVLENQNQPSHVSPKQQANSKTIQSVVPSSLSQDSLRIVTNDHIPSLNPVLNQAFCDVNKPCQGNGNENIVKRHISSDNLAPSYLGSTPDQSCFSYEEPTNQPISISNQNQSACCKTIDDFSVQDNCTIIRQKTESNDVCACAYTQHRCPCPDFHPFSGYSDYPNNSSAIHCDHHRYGYSSDMNTCGHMNSIPVFLCKSEPPENNKNIEDSLDHLSLRSSMYAVPMIPQTRCACQLPQSAMHGFGKAEQNFYSLYDNVSIIIISSLF